jgi:ribose 5-phosphate isomerase B
MSTNFNLQIPIAFGSDHAGFDYKKELMALVEAAGATVIDAGPFSADSVDYPDFAHPVAAMVEEGRAAFGVLICGSGNGVAITANKHAKIRAALCWNEELAKLARMHNNANILCLPARFIELDLAKKMLLDFMNTPFEGGRHEKRVEKIPC